MSAETRRLRRSYEWARRRWRVLRRGYLRGGEKRPSRAEVLAARARMRVRLKRLRLARASEFHEAMLNGHPGDVADEVEDFIVRAVRAGLVVTSTTDLRHSSTSHHYPRNNADRLGHAADVAGADRKMRRFQRAERRERGREYRELFGPDNDMCVKNGEPLALAEGSALEDLHDSHVHGAL